MRRCVFRSAIVLLTCAAFAQGQEPSAIPKEDGRKGGFITGRVLGEDGQPVGKAMVEYFSLGPNARYHHPVTTDGDGNFKLTNLPRASYRVSVTSPGFIAAQQGSQPSVYRVGDHITLRLVKGGVITGRVLDLTGDPIVATYVTARKIREENGLSTSAEVSRRMSISRITDDRGIYRIYGLPAGVYLVSTQTQIAPYVYASPSIGLTYHPSSTREGATEITVQPGQEISGIDIRARNEQGLRISGRVIAEQGVFIEPGSLLVNLINRLDGQSENIAMVKNSGAWELSGVFDGEYDLFAAKYSREQNLRASPMMRITVRGADLNGLSLTLKPLGSIGGKVLVETTAPAQKCNPATSFSREEITLAATPSRPNPDFSLPPVAYPSWMQTGNSVSEKGEFNLRHLLPGTYQLSADLPDESWYVKSLDRGKNAPPMPAGIPLKLGETINDVQLTIADRGTSLAGRVEGKKKMRVYLFPAAASNDLLRHAETTTNADASFQFNHLAPGKYLLLAKPAPATDPEIPQLWNAAERAALRREAEAAKKEIELLSCKPMKSYVLTP